VTRLLFPTPLRVAVLISGGGTTLKNLLEKQAAGQAPIDVALVISSSAQAGGLAHAAAAGIAAQVCDRSRFDSDLAHSQAIFAACRAAGVSLVLMAGFLKFVPIPDDFAGRVLNIHPALIPSFCGAGMYGRRVHAAALAYGVKLSGCTVHFVDNQYDHGPILLQRETPVHEGDTPETLAARVFATECEAYPEALRLIAAGRVSLEGRLVRIAADSSAGASL